jgi:saposin
LSDADHSYMLETNRIPTSRSRPSSTQSRTQLSALDTCDECKFIVEKIDDIVKNPAKLEELKNMLNLFCDTLGSKAEDCKTIVNNIEHIIEDVGPMLENPTQLCQTLHLCGTGRMAKINRFIILLFKKKLHLLESRTASNDLLCDECEFAVTEVKELVAQKDIQEEIKSFAHQICSYLGSEMSQECDNLVDDYLPTLFQELEDLLKDPKAVCVEIGLCTTASRPLIVNSVPLFSSLGAVSSTSLRQHTHLNSFLHLLKSLQTRRGVKATCFFCRFGMTSILQSLRPRAVQTRIANTLERLLCDRLLPREFKAGCSDFSRHYMETFVNMTLSTFDSRTVCHDTGLCTVTSLQTIVDAHLGENEHNDVLCESCHVLSAFLGQELAERPLQEDLIHWVRHFYCTSLPQSWSQQCDALVEQYGFEFLNLAVNYLRDERFCSMIDLCPAAVVETLPKKVGENDILYAF